MKRNLLLGLAALSLFILLTGCNKAPQVEIDAATAAIVETQSIGADVYLPDEFIALNDSMNSIQFGIESKKSKWFAGYKEEKEQLNNIVVMANTLKQNTEVRKNEVREDVMTTLSNVNALLAENEQLLTEAPKGKEGAAALLAIKEEISMLHVSVGEITKMVDAGDYLNAQSKAVIVNDKAQSINLELKEAIAKYNSRKR